MFVSPVIRASRWALALGLMATLPAHAQATSEATSPPQTAEAASSVTLEPVVVVVISERDTGYLEPDTKSATKTDTPVIDTQQSISVINRERLDAQGVLTM